MLASLYSSEGSVMEVSVPESNLGSPTPGVNAPAYDVFAAHSGCSMPPPPASTEGAESTRRISRGKPESVLRCDIYVNLGTVFAALGLCIET